MFHKIALLEILKSPLSTGVQAYSTEFERFEPLTKFLKVGLKFPKSDIRWSSLSEICKPAKCSFKPCVFLKLQR